jgi:hypothetical protein
MDSHKFTLAWKPTRATNPLNSIYACLHGNYILTMIFLPNSQSPFLKSKHFGDFESKNSNAKKSNMQLHHFIAFLKNSLMFLAPSSGHHLPNHLNGKFFLGIQCVPTIEMYITLFWECEHTMLYSVSRPFQFTPTSSLCTHL